MNSTGNDIKQLYDKDRGQKTVKEQSRALNVKILLFAGIVIILVLIYIGGSIYWWNEDIKELNAIYAQEFQIEKECKRRDDMIPTLITIARDYASHERALFQYVSDVRLQLKPAASMREGSSASNSGELLSKLIALSEQYPDLKATKSFQDLMDMMETTEDRIALMRDNYINATKEYNKCNQRFWCPFFTYIINLFAPLPAFIDYYYFKSHFIGGTDEIGTPLMQQEELSEKEKSELKQPTPLGRDSLENNKREAPILQQQERLGEQKTEESQ